MGVRKLSLPLYGKEARWLRAGDLVFLTGEVVTARDRSHLRMTELLSRGETLPFNLEGGALYHCGPLVRKEGGEWRVLSAGPTTSARMDPLLPFLLPKLRVRTVIGKGGVGEKTKKVMGKVGCVYLAFPGGCGALAAKAVRGVKAVHWPELGLPEAVWVLEVKGFGPLVVAVDCLGGDLYRKGEEGEGVHR